MHGPKRGFSIPAAAWLRGPLLNLARDVLSPDALRSAGLVDPAIAGRLLDEHVARRDDHSRALWGLVCFSLSVSDRRGGAQVLVERVAIGDR